MNIDLILLFVFAIILGLVMLINKTKIKIEKIAFPLIYILMYRTKWGLNLMDKIARKYPRFVNFFALFIKFIFCCRWSKQHCGIPRIILFCYRLSDR